MRRSGKLVALTLVLWALGCGDGKTQEDDAGIQPDDAGLRNCSEATLKIDCPVRECEVAVACNEGECVYEEFVCAQEGRVCPVESCRASTEGGAIVNECIEVKAAPCGEGGSCVGDACILPVNALQLSGDLGVGNVNTEVGGLQLEGELSHLPQNVGVRKTPGLKISGGLQVQ